MHTDTVHAHTHCYCTMWATVDACSCLRHTVQLSPLGGTHGGKGESQVIQSMKKEGENMDNMPPQMPDNQLTKKKNTNSPMGRFSLSAGQLNLLGSKAFQWIREKPPSVTQWYR